MPTCTKMVLLLVGALILASCRDSADSTGSAATPAIGSEITASLPIDHGGADLQVTSTSRPLLFRADESLDQAHDSFATYELEVWYPSNPTGRTYIRLGGEPVWKVYTRQASPTGVECAYEKWLVKLHFYSDGSRDVVVSPLVSYEAEYPDTTSTADGRRSSIRPPGPRLYRVYADNTVADRGMTGSVISSTRVIEAPLNTFAFWDPMFLSTGFAKACVEGDAIECNVDGPKDRPARLAATTTYNVEDNITLRHNVDVLQWVGVRERAVPEQLLYTKQPSVSIVEMHTESMFTLVETSDGRVR